MSSKETIVVVHGTFAGPVDGQTKWWQRSVTSNLDAIFTRQLDIALQHRGSTARCWQHCEDGGKEFWWSDANDWIDRTAASEALVEYLKNLRTDGYQVHLIAHSHGGNVVLDALTSLAPLEPSLRSITTIGTPFIDTQTLVESRKSQYARATLLLSKGALALFFLAGLQYTLALINSPLPLWGLLILLLVFGGTLGALETRREKRVANVEKPLAMEAIAISSSVDEAWQTLFHIRTMDDPLAEKRGILSYIWAQYIATLKQRNAVQRLQGKSRFRDVGWFWQATLLAFYALLVASPFLVHNWLSVAHAQFNAFTLDWFGRIVIPQVPIPLEIGTVAGLLIAVCCLSVIAATAFIGVNFYSAALAPFRLVWNGLLSFSAIPNDLIVYVVRRNAWKIIQMNALGLNGLRFDVPEVKQQAISNPLVHFSLELLPEAVQRDALTRRSKWLDSQIASVTTTLSNTTVAADINALLRKISNDPTLVHAAYYTDQACIERIADWICGADERTKPHEHLADAKSAI